MDDRRGNPSDPAEEAERVRKAYENLDNWGKRYGGFSGGVSMQMGSGRKYEVPIGDREIAQKVVSRPLPGPHTVESLPQTNFTVALPSGTPTTWREATWQKIEPSSDSGVENRATSESTNRQERVAGLNVRSATIQRRVSPSGLSEAIPRRSWFRRILDMIFGEKA